MPKPELGGLRVLVTRPAHQAAPLCAHIEAAGGRAVLLPALAIAPPSDPGPARARLARAGDYDLLVFVSPNAVRGAFDLAPDLSPARIAVVGQGTARALRERIGREPELCPQARYDSEGLLALPALAAVTGWKVLIVRGEGGRELLAEGLRAREAQVEYAEVYRRTAPVLPAEAVAALRAEAVDVATVTSAEGLRQLVELLEPPARERLLALPLVTVTERMLPLAQELGFRRVRVARHAGDAALLEAIAQWQAEGFDGDKA